jgi:uncharacterized protein YjbI with pentapeptide repeats
MVGRRLALIIATSKYLDPTLKQLTAPAQDAKALAEVLENDNIGNFEVRILLDTPSQKIKRAIEEFFGGERNRDDLLLLYFSCHGIKGTDTQLYFATSDTNSKFLFSTAVRARDVNELMSTCLAWRQILILDCCYSGAFARGMTVRDDKQIHTNEHFEEGRGRLVMTASDSMQYSFEPEVEGNVKQEQDNIVRSFFTDALVQGLRTGEADRDENGHITYDELYDYVRDHVRQNSPKQTPRKWGFDVQGDIVIAQNPKVKEKEVEVVQEQQQKKENQSLQLLKLLQEQKVEEFNRKRKEVDFAPLFFRNVDLSDKILNGADFHDMDFSGAKIVNAKIRMANLTGANLKGADLSGTELRGADLYRSDLSGSNLTKTDLRNADLRGMIDFAGSDLTGADLRGADLKGIINFDGAVLYDVDFTGAKIDTKLVNFKGAKFNKNVAGLPTDSLFVDNNKYVKDIKAFSEAIEKQFKPLTIDPQQVKSIEVSVKELTKEVEDINDDEKKLTNIKKQNIKTWLVTVLGEVVDTLPKTNKQTLDVFDSLKSFGKLIGEEEFQQIIQNILSHKEKENLDIRKGDPSVVAPKVAVSNTPSWIPGGQLRLDENLIKLLRESKVAEFNSMRKQRPHQLLKLNGVDLSGAKLRGVDLHKADLLRVNLGRAELHEADLSEANLTDASLVEAILVQTNLKHATLNRTDFSRADLNRANLTEVRMDHGKFCEANLTEADISRSYITYTDFSNANLYRTKLIATTIRTDIYTRVDAKSRGAIGGQVYLT